MKRLLTLVGVLGLLSIALAQPTQYTIYDLQYTTDPTGDSPHLGEFVQTYGIVTAYFGSTFFIEERPGGEWHGIQVYTGGASVPQVSVGDSVEVIGTVAEYNNMTEISIGTDGSVTIIASGVPLPGTTVVTVAQLRDLESLEGVLLRVDSVYFVESGTFTSGVYHIVSLDYLDTAVVYIKSQTNIPGSSIPPGLCSLIGNGAQWYSDHELYPRSTDDIISFENLPPAIAYVFRNPYTPEPNQSVFFETDVTDIDGTVASVLLYYSLDNGGSWSVVPPDSTSGSLYYFSLPGFADGTSALYYIESQDNLGAITTSDTGAFVVATVPQIKINEVHYDAAGITEPYAEWVELYNAGNTAVDMSNWVFADDPDPNNPSGSFDGVFIIPSGTVLNPGEFLILAYDADTFNFYWPDHGTAQVVAYGVGTGATIYLGNSGSDIHVFDANLNPVDVMWYGSGGDLYYMGHAAPDVFAGHSLVRLLDGDDSDDPSLDFTDSDTTCPGPTPGYPNLLCGDMNMDHVVNVIDLAYFATFFFSGGPSPCSTWAADVNGDGVVNVIDLAKMATFFFAGGTLDCSPL